ncbi:MAG: sialidase family protein, partial [Pseudomonadota bacterium]
HCIDGDLECVGEVGPADEICDGLDNNCDGETDEDDPGGGGPCGTDTGACTPGVWHCIDGELVCDEGVMPEDEICNGIDDDCDGDVDEGNPGGGELCGTDEGECEPGLTWCSSSGVEPPCGPPDPLPDPPELLCLCAVGPVDEVCDCLDNDCNMLVDDGLPLGEACGTDEGECRPGYMVCLDCDWECSYDVGPSPEICDCLDNDCNGLEDDGDICEEGICYRDVASCYCALPCNPAHEFPCPSGKTCAEAEGHDGYYCIDDPCAGVTCEDCTQTCLEGECIDKCDRVECGDDEVCVYSGCSPMCVPRNCYAPGYECAEGKICRDGECRHDPCYDVECGDLQFCRDGECFDACTAQDACPEGDLCHDGACAEDLCRDVDCAGGRVCDPETGRCEEDACDGVSCPPPQVCIDGRCTDDPCSFIACPQGYECVGDTCIESSLLEEDGAGESDGEDISSSPVNVTSTGGGGCAACSVAGQGGRDGAAAWLLALPALAFLLLLAVRRRKKCPQAGAGTRMRGMALLFASLAFAALAGAGCHMEYECLDNCDAGGTDAAGEADLDDAAETAADTVGDEAGDEERDVSGEDTPCNPLAEEECNGMDDDCDELIDEGFDLDTDPRNCGACGNVCHFPHAFAMCDGGECVIGDCDINTYDCAADDPEDSESLGCETLCFKTRDRDDICNNVDDDCNCLVDDLIDKTADPENCGVCGERCNPRNGVGECVSPDGTEENAQCVIDECSEGFWNINGEYGDGCEYECSRCERTVGACEAGMTCCTAEGDETCNGMDDNCDGELDEDNPGGGEPCGTDEGLCEFGTYDCVAGELRCVGGVRPEDEICDGEDNDCNGESDEGDPGGGADCGTDAGECSPGVEHCVEGIVECAGETPSRPELCNGLDDDCDGIIDDGNPEGGADCGTDVGTCAFGTQKCIDGDLACEGGIGSVDEICDGLDNNCNGVPDEDNPEGGEICGTSDGECETGITACIDGDLVCAGETPPSPELCNGLDDDCDGEADDGDPEGGGECGTDVGECSKGTVHCIDDSLECTGEDGPVPETCDGNDNDCDGETDEGVSGEGIRCGTNRGTCEYGTTLCVDGDMECSGEVAPVTPEPCDGLDNDCDGRADNNLAPPGISCLTQGVCSGTAPTCDGSAGYRCHYPGTYQAVETWCDGLDNNCDGADDEGCPLLDAGDIRLDAGTANSAQIDLATDGSGVVHAVYLDRRNAYSGTYRADIYYSHSVDGGVSWLGTDIRLDTNSPGETNSMSPAIAHGQGGGVFTAWADFRISTDTRDIYTVDSPSNGNAGTWSSPDERIDAGSQIDSYGVDMAADASGYVYVVYEDLQADRSRHVFLARSTDSGASWDSPAQIDHNTAPAPAIAGEPHVAVDGSGGVFVAWRDNRHGNGAIYFNTSIDRGDSWQASDTRLDTDSPPGHASSGRPRIAADASGNVYVVWEDFRNGYSDIYVNYSNDSGASWSTADIRLDMDPLGHDSTNPVIAAGAGGMAWTAFQDLRNGLADIYVNRTADGGVSWLVEDLRVDTDARGTAGSYLPAIDAVGNLVVVAWHDGRNDEDADVFMDVVMNFSLDGGAFFQPVDFQVNPSSGYRDTTGVRVAAESGRAHFAWVDFRNDSHMTGDIYVRTLR